MPTKKQTRYWESLKGKRTPGLSKWFKNHDHPNLGKHLSKKTREKIGLSRMGDKNPMKIPTIAKKVSDKLKGRPTLHNAGNKNYNWKGDKVGYGGLHIWVRKNLGKPNKCEHCKTVKGKFEWANKDHKYKRKLSDWIRLCPQCHRIYDRDVLKIKIGRY